MRLQKVKTDNIKVNIKDLYFSQSILISLLSLIEFYSILSTMLVFFIEINPQSHYFQARNFRANQKD